MASGSDHEEDRVMKVPCQDYKRLPFGHKTTVGQVLREGGGFDAIITFASVFEPLG